MKKNNLETLFNDISELIDNVYTIAYESGYKRCALGYGDDNNPTRAYLDSGIKKELDEFKERFFNKHLNRGKL